MSDRVNRLEEQMSVVFRELNRNAEAISDRPQTSEMQTGFNEAMQWLGTIATRQEAI